MVYGQLTLMVTCPAVCGSVNPTGHSCVWVCDDGLWSVNSNGNISSCVWVCDGLWSVRSNGHLSRRDGGQGTAPNTPKAHPSLWSVPWHWLEEFSCSRSVKVMCCPLIVSLLSSLPGPSVRGKYSHSAHHTAHATFRTPTGASMETRWHSSGLCLGGWGG